MTADDEAVCTFCACQLSVSQIVPGFSEKVPDLGSAALLRQCSYNYKYVVYNIPGMHW